MKATRRRGQGTQNKSLIRQMFRDIIEPEELDSDAVSRYFSPRYMQKVDGKKLDFAGFVDHLNELKRSLNKLRVTFEYMVSEGDKVMDIHRVEGKKRDGAEITARVISLWVIESGKIVLCDELTRLERGAPEDHDLASRKSLARS